MVKKITTVENDVRKIDDIKEELVDYSKKVIDKEVQNSFKKLEKKLISRKNFKIIKRDILIIFLLALCGFLSYNLYKTGYFNKYFYINENGIILNKDKNNSSEVKDNTKPNEDVEPEPEVKPEEKDLSFHKVALDLINVNSSFKYLNEFYSGELNNELLLAISLNNMNKELITIDEDTYLFSSEDLEKSFNNTFKDIEFSNSSFNYNGLNIKYLKSQNIYYADKEIKNSDSNIIRYVKNIEEKDNIVTITTIEAVLNNNKIYNVLTKGVVAKYKDEESLKTYEAKLNTINYVFNYEDGVYKLIDINNTK